MKCLTLNQSKLKSIHTQTKLISALSFTIVAAGMNYKCKDRSSTGKVLDVRERQQYTYIKGSDNILIFPSSFNEIQGGFKFTENSVTFMYNSWCCYSLGPVQDCLDILGWEVQIASLGECPVMDCDRRVAFFSSICEQNFTTARDCKKQIWWLDI